MPGDAETNVRLPRCAKLALDRIAAGRPRAATLRRLLRDYVDVQAPLEPGQRQTHISTLLRYPLRRTGPSTKLAGRVHDNDVALDQVRIRLPDRSLLDDAVAFAFTLPGQPHRGGPSDYQARPLTDVVMTAIALQEPFSDDFLDGLHPLITHRAAIEVWHLTVALTLTRAERAALAGRDSDSARARRIAQLLEDDQEAWHHDQRLVVLRRQTRALLGGPDAPSRARDLAAGRLGWVAELAEELPGDTYTSRHDEIGAVGDDWGPTGKEGRGGTAVWRATHTAALMEIPDWLAGTPHAHPLLLSVNHGADGIAVDDAYLDGLLGLGYDYAGLHLGDDKHGRDGDEDEGGSDAGADEDEEEAWNLAPPKHWHTVAPGARLTDPAAVDLEDAVAAGRLLSLDRTSGQPQVLWPVDTTGRLIDRLPLALHAAETLSPAEKVELLLMDPQFSVHPTFTQARAWGLLSETAVRAEQAADRDATIQAMKATYETAVADGASSVTRAALRTALDDSLSEFSRVCAAHGIPFTHTPRRRWDWDAPRLADAVDDPAVPDEALEWLGRERVRSRVEQLRRAQRQAWLAVAARFQRDVLEAHRRGRPPPEPETWTAWSTGL